MRNLKLPYNQPQCTRNLIILKAPSLLHYWLILGTSFDWITTFEIMVRLFPRVHIVTACTSSCSLVGFVVSNSHACYRLGWEVLVRTGISVGVPVAIWLCLVSDWLAWRLNEQTQPTT